MNPVRYAVRNPYTIAVAVILTSIFSVRALERIPVQLKPTVDTPIISIRTLYPGAGPVDVEQQITRKIEDLLQGVDGLRKLSSTSTEGVSQVTLEYEWGVDKDRAMVDVVNKLAQLPDLPPDAEQPVAALSGDEGANNAMWIVVHSRLPVDEVRQRVIEDVQPQLERVPGVSRLMVIGGAEREIRVLVDPEALAARGISFSDLEGALRSAYRDQRGGTVETAARQLVVRTEGRSPDLSVLRDLVLRRDANGSVRVRDVARVRDSFKEVTGIVRNSGRRSVVIGVGRETGANVVDLVAGVEAQMATLDRSFRERGLDLRLEAVYRDTTYLENAMAFVRSNLLLGAALAVGVLLLFLRSVRSVLIVALAIPISLLTVFWVLDALGRSLNVISLAGLAFASGMVVDNAIVVLENIFRHLERGRPAVEAAERGGREVWGGVLAATLTTIVVFLPVLGIREEAGQLFADLALAIAAAVGISLVVALTVVPMLVAFFYRRRGARGSRAAADEEGEGIPARAGFLSGLYRRTLDLLVGRGKPSLFFKLGLLAFSGVFALAALRLVPPAGYLPTGNRNLTFFFGQPIPGLPPETLERALHPLEQWILDQPETQRYFLVLAPGFHGGGVMLKPELVNGERLAEFRKRFFPVCFSAPGFRYLLPVQASLFRDSGKQFTVEISGADFRGLAAAAEHLQRGIEALPGVTRVSSDFVEGQPELRVRVDPQRAAEMRMSVQDLGAVVEAAIAGRRVGTYSDGGRDYDLEMVVPPERVSSAEQLADLPLVTPTGVRTTLSALARVERSSGPQSVNRLERQRAITLTVNLGPDAVLQQVIDAAQTGPIAAELAQLPPSYRIDLGGSADKFQSTLDALTGSFGLAVLITYLLLVALFRSWLSPIVILVSVPLALTGGLLGVSLATRLSVDASYDLLAMLGFVILAGVVVNNAILILHQANQFREGGMERRQALAEAAQSRLRPILMSVSTSVFGMLPLAVGRGAGAELYQGLAAVVVGGLLFSTVFTLGVVPALTSLGWDLGEVWGGRGER